MVEKGRAAIYNGLGKPFEIKEYPVPDPEPGAILIKVSMATICGSDLHMWRGDLDLAALGPAGIPTASTSARGQPSTSPIKWWLIQHLS